MPLLLTLVMLLWSSSEADHLEEAEGNAEADDCMAGMAASDGAPNLEGKNSAVCVINAQGIIQMVNKVIVCPLLLLVRLIDEHLQSALDHLVHGCL